MKIGDTVRVRRPGLTVLIPVVEYHGRIIGVDTEGRWVEVLDDQRRAPGLPGSIFREAVEDVMVGWWERVWHDGAPPEGQGGA